MKIRNVHVEVGSLLIHRSDLLKCKSSIGGKETRQGAIIMLSITIQDTNDLDRKGPATLDVIGRTVLKKPEHVSDRMMEATCFPSTLGVGSMVQ